jgi:DNA polymerase-4
LRESKVNPIKVAVEIKRRIKDEVGDWLTCSAGLGNNRFLAKLASGMMKPDGLSVVFKDNLRQAYEGLKLSDLWGIARGWTARLGRLGITTPVELMDYPVQNLVSLFGKSGFYIWRRVCGLEEDSMSADEQPPKSFGNSWVLDFRTTDKSRIMPVIMYLAEKAARRMRKEGFCARGIYLVIDCGGGKFGFAKSKRLGFLVESGQQFYEQANLLLAGWRPDAEVKRIAAGFMMLKQRASQLDMFGDGQRRLLEAMDFVNDRYGEFFVRSGFLARCSDFAPDSIAFGK